MSKRKAFSQGGRSQRKTPLQRHFVEDSDDEEAPIPHQRHIHRSWSSAHTRDGVSVRTSTFTTKASPHKPKLPRVGPEKEWHVEERSEESQSDGEVPATGVDPNYEWRVADRAVKETRKRKKQPSDEPLNQWIPLRQEFLDELVRLEGRGENLHLTQCPTCELPDQEPEFRCRDCFGGEMLCNVCLLHTHKCHPLHRIERWNGSHFQAVDLKSLGLRIQLGHRGRRCMNPRTGPADFVVIDSHSIQSVSINFCGCQAAESHIKQLLRVRWYPATVINPSTVATFRVLAHFHLSTLQSKQSAFDFYSAVERETDNTELRTPPDRYEAFLRMVREWRHLKQLKRFGRGLPPEGVRTTREGDLAMSCPACPHPEINLPEGWEDAPDESRWLYNLILAVDANFRLRCKLPGKNGKDAPLGSGWGYFVESVAYKLHLQNCGSQKDVSTCSNLAAINQVNRQGKGLSATGVGACICARHQLLRRNGVADLQHGERYCNMDYLFFSTLRGEKLRQLVVSYDISCQWYKKLWERMAALPNEFQLDLSKILVRFVVPKFHLPAHVEPCQSPFSLNYCSGVGRTDGEGIERDWSMINPVAYSTKEMTPGHRADTLDDHWGDWNWRKVSGMGRAIARRIKAAVPERIKHVCNFRTMCESLPASRVQEWTQMVQAWEREMAEKLPRDVLVVNPYTLPVADITQPAVRLQLAQDDAARGAAGEVTMHEVTPSQFIITGLELQEQQYRLREDRQGLINGTNTQRANLQERRNLLRRKIDAWMTIQSIYMPMVPQIRTNIERRVAAIPKPSVHAAEPEEHALLLPSEISEVSSGGLLGASLRTIELRLREAQAHDALQGIRHFLRLLSFLWKNKKKNARGQKENTRSHTLIKRTEAKKSSSVQRYRRAWCALTVLAPNGAWTNSLNELRDGDVRGVSEGEGDQTEGRRTVSWIWTAHGIGTGAEAEDVALHDSLRVEWCKARARALRWTEEIQLLREEMRRVLEWLTWRARWWKSLAGQRSGVSIELQEGVHSCASRQAQLQADLRNGFLKLWKESLAFVDAEIAEAEGAKKTE